MLEADHGHDPVLMQPVLEFLAIQPGMVCIDCTTGRGGHSLAMANALGPAGLLICLDMDPSNLTYAQKRLEAAPCTVRLFHANFGELDDVLAEVKPARVDAILADLGVSTNQLFDPRYGLSFANAMPLDMRLDPRIEETAADLVNTLSEQKLADLLFQLADEHYSRRIARKIVETRRVCPINTTERLAEVVRSALPQRGGAPSKIDPATKTFMALRMAVNRETQNLDALLEAAPRLLSPGGRFGVISFHSTEDRAVKQAFRSAEQTGHVRLLTGKPVPPDPSETERNPRSRSAKLRVVQRLAS